MGQSQGPGKSQRANREQEARQGICRSVEAKARMSLHSEGDGKTHRLEKRLQRSQELMRKRSLGWSSHTGSNVGGLKDGIHRLCNALGGGAARAQAPLLGPSLHISPVVSST